MKENNCSSCFLYYNGECIHYTNPVRKRPDDTCKSFRNRFMKLPDWWVDKYLDCEYDIDY